MKKIFLYGIFSLSLAITSCSSSDNNEGNNNDSAIDLAENVVSAENVLIYIPSPIETAELLKQAGAQYNKEILNKPTSISKYSSTAAAALNLGVYGCDLAFAGIFDQTAETMIYMDCTRKLADVLHVSAAFSDERKNRLEANINKRDSVLAIITDAYSECDGLLQDNKQSEASALMMAGGWVEGLFLACKIAETTNNNSIRIRIAEQRYSLDKLIKLLEKNKDEESVAITKDLKELQYFFNQLPKQEQQPVAVSKDSTTGVTVIGDDSEPAESLNALEFKRITDKISAIRSDIISKN
ncbi:MAG: hypothetical protein Fur0041_01830 [Bacteroidia bacterium]